MPSRKKRDQAEIATTESSADASEGILLPAAVGEDVVTEVFDELCAMQRAATVELAVQMGKLIVDRFYGGKFDAWREHGAKETSLRKLADRFENTEGGLSAAGIYRVIAIYELEERHHVSARKQLTVTHVRAVIGLPEKEQGQLLDEAEKRNWSTRELEEKAAAIRKKNGDGRGRPPLPAFVKSINKLKKMVDDKTAFEDLEQVDDLDEDEVTDLYQAVTGMKLKCEALQKSLEARSKDFRS